MGAGWDLSRWKLCLPRWGKRAVLLCLGTDGAFHAGKSLGGTESRRSIAIFGFGGSIKYILYIYSHPFTMTYELSGH
jgi:hypothetical protein